MAHSRASKLFCTITFAKKPCGSQKWRWQVVMDLSETSGATVSPDQEIGRTCSSSIACFPLCPSTTLKRAFTKTHSLWQCFSTGGTLRQIWEKQGDRLWTGFIWLRIGTGDRLLWTWYLLCAVTYWRRVEMCTLFSIFGLCKFMFPYKLHAYLLQREMWLVSYYPSFAGSLWQKQASQICALGQHKSLLLTKFILKVCRCSDMNCSTTVYRSSLLLILYLTNSSFILTLNLMDIIPLCFHNQ